MNSQAHAGQRRSQGISRSQSPGIFVNQGVMYGRSFEDPDGRLWKRVAWPRWSWRCPAG
jgi:predicted lactoylglutathione lyase